MTRGWGFTALHLVEMLLQDNMYCVCIIDLGPTIELEPTEQLGVLGQAFTLNVPNISLSIFVTRAKC
ncbi:hypothetical protein SESBI_30418 [Sesbania bispinosa]|nr:hypothetical protein SESBI_30418 [Sesbania bispinosa]